MAATINASTSPAGIVQTADGTGILALQTAGTTAVTIDASQNVGIGTATPTRMFDISKTTGDANIAITSSTTGQSSIFFADTDTNVGMIYYEHTNDAMGFRTNDAERMRIDSSGNVGIGTASPATKLNVTGAAATETAIKISGSTTAGSFLHTSNTGGNFYIGKDNSAGTAFGSAYCSGLYSDGAYPMIFWTNSTERMRIDSSGNVFFNKTTSSTSTVGFQFIVADNKLAVGASSGASAFFNRNTDDGAIVQLAQDGAVEGTISVSGTTVSYNGGHLSRWSQWQNETGQPNVYRGTVLESTNAMCVWEKDGEPLPNEQATKTIVSTTVASKAVAGVFDMYDVDDETNPYDFYVAQSGDFVIRIAQGVTVQNGDLLESAGDGTAKPQADDICRSSTIAKVTSNYVSATYEDGSYCVPCILMIG